MTTQRYVELYAVASSVKDAKKLIEQGFEYVFVIDGEQLFRKVK